MTHTCKYGARLADGKCPKKPKSVKNTPPPKKTKSVRACKYGARLATGKCPTKTKGRIDTKNTVTVTIKNRMAAHRVMTHLMQHKDKYTAKFLKHICPDTDDCLGFGTESMRIFDFFQFQTFNHATKVKQLAKGSNGFVTRIQYERNKYNAYAVLKSALKASSDNLYYEAFVGLEYINKHALPFFPCFMQTYGAYQYKDAQSVDRLFACNDKSSVHTVSDRLTKSLINHATTNLLKNTRYTNYGDYSCANSKIQAVLIQHIKNPVSFQMYMKMLSTPFELLFEIATHLYQVYEPLSRIADEFTHYDLHSNNVCLYKIPKGQCIRMNYIDKDGTVLASFLSQYIVKIIDYGRSYCMGNDKILIDPLLDLKKCGYAYTDHVANKDDYYISSRFKNVSHDLRLVAILKAILRTSLAGKGFPLYDRLFEPLLYTDAYGSKTTPVCQPDILCNVHAMADALRKYVMNYVSTPELIASFPPSFQTVYGTMNVFVDRNKEMEFIVA
jgi:hypothetical protein